MVNFIHAKSRKGKVNMAVSYKKLWHLLIDKDMKKKDLQEAANLTSHAMRKLSRDGRQSQQIHLPKFADALIAR